MAKIEPVTSYDYTRCKLVAAVANRRKKRVAGNKIIKMEDLRRKRYAVEKIAGRKKLRGSNGASSKWHKNEAIASERTERHPSCELVGAARPDATSSTCLCKFVGIAGDHHSENEMQSRLIGYGV